MNPDVSIAKRDSFIVNVLVTPNGQQRGMNSRPFKEMVFVKE